MTDGFGVGPDANSASSLKRFPMIAARLGAMWTQIRILPPRAPQWAQKEYKKNYCCYYTIAHHVPELWILGGIGYFVLIKHSWCWYGRGVVLLHNFFLSCRLVESLYTYCIEKTFSDSMMKNVSKKRGKKQGRGGCENGVCEKKSQIMIKNHKGICKNAVSCIYYMLYG